jgi:hypothetical protein
MVPKNKTKKTLKEEIKYAGTESSGPAGLTKEQIQEIQKNISYRRKYKLK